MTLAADQPQPPHVVPARAAACRRDGHTWVPSKSDAGLAWACETCPRPMRPAGPA